ncbi:MAG: amidohydrolase, partial [Clostridiales Family XIII bacterium]|nr:amidohydrolase [Clostridiales Family XIII bacterium]
MDAHTVKQDIYTWTAANSDVFYEIAQKIWETPELSMQEFKSSRILQDALGAQGFRVEPGAGGMPSAFVATFGSGAPGQGCGHNLLGTGAVKAAAALRHAMEKRGLAGTIKVIGAPAEELCLGKPFLGKAG